MTVEPMPGSGTVTVGTPVIAGGVATYAVDVSIPIHSVFPVWTPDIEAYAEWSALTIGYVAADGTMAISGQFTRRDSNTRRRQRRPRRQ